jgi:glycolate oxidase iron-sulfur subunit
VNTDQSGLDPAQPGIGDPGTVVKDVAVAASAGAFDVFNPPSADRVDDCVHCGFCLPSCPTYALWGEEMDSPRGRIYLMRMGLEGEVAMNTRSSSISTPASAAWPASPRARPVCATTS